MPTHLVMVPAFVLLLASSSQADTSTWSQMTAPAGIFAAAGLPESPDPAFSLLTLIRMVHSTENDEAARVRDEIEAALRASGEEVVLPLPLPAALFGAVLQGDLSGGRFFPAFIRDRRASLFYCGAMAMNAETRAFLATQPDLTRELMRDRAPVVAAFARSLRVEAGRVAVPGGDAAVPAWEELVDARVTEPAEFIRRLFASREGRTAYLFDAIAHLGAAQQRFALPHLAALHRVFTEVDREWAVARAPFVRPLHDAALLLRRVPLDEAGALVGVPWKALWQAAFESDDLPRQPEKAFARVTRGPRLDAAWLTGAVVLSPVNTRRQRYEQFAFGARVFGRVPAASAPEVVLALRGFSRYPAMMLGLERMGITTPAVYVAAARRAQAVAGIQNRRRAIAALAQFQGVLAILDRVARGGRIDRDGLERLVVSLCDVATDEGRYAGRLATWIDETLVPALRDPQRNDTSIETILLHAMADRSPGADGTRLEWEGLPYVIDYAAGQRSRFEQVRARHNGNRLDDVLALARESRARRPIAHLTRALKPLRDWPSVPGSAPAFDSGDAGEIVDHALAEVLLAIVYAPHQGEASELFPAAADLFHRHDFGVAEDGITEEARGRYPWMRPRIGDLPGQMRVSGALLGLDLALGRFALRRLAADRMPERPRLNQGDRDVLTSTVAMINPRLISDAEMRAIALAMQRGRARVAGAGGDSAALDRLAEESAMSEVRRQILSWSASRRTSALERLFSLEEILSLGGGSAGNAWGTFNEPISGCYCLAFPDGTAWETFAGRPGLGLVSARVADVTLRLAELFVEIGAPAVLLPGALAYTLQDLIDEAPSMHTDDWDALVQHAHALDRVRVEDYIAGVAARGPLTLERRP